MAKPKHPATATEGEGSKAGVRPRKRRNKRRTPARQESSSYVVRVADWDYYYSFHASDPKSRWETGPYGELATLSFQGEIIRPRDCRYKTATATFSGKSHMMEEVRTEGARSIGSLTAQGDELSAYVFVPQERLAELTSVAQSGKVQIVHFSGTKLRYRSASISSISLHTKFDEDEW
ncbi:hypothetical protein [Aminobacter sp. AP02]|uniref:hypothetical protein n=1 Tax=Aminobacter sp. AP02 TaxID=2135737 RepID=UPI000D7B89AF|nr:hypothetical protein [Aminobacter sp. AP02]PWK64642.1 hypothetical protein C8K44_11983 [Aminobacter sp. AP02]